MNKISKINWKDVVEGISHQEGEVRTMGAEFYQNNDGRFDNIISSWIKAGYNSNKVEWINFYPEKHFDNTISETFSKEVETNHIRSWISCIRPGKSAPWHQDIDDLMEDYKTLGRLKRFTCFINIPYHGQVMSIEKQAFYMVPVNSIFEWNHWQDWHGAGNCGFENYYLYHFLGYV